jgi:protein-S-isoprenylcysteine O-methyltransferase Ste14
MNLYNTTLVSRAFAIAGGLLFVGSLVFFAIAYTWRFSGILGPWSVAGSGRPAVIDAAMFSGFALHHSLFARSGGREWISRHVAPGLERSVYVWIASLLFLLVCFAWLPVPGIAWQTTGLTAGVSRLVQVIGAVLTIVAAKQLNFLELAGVTQALSRDAGAPVRLDRGPYRLVRHPIYLGWFAMVWCPPVMNGTRLAFAAVSCAYLLMAVPFEERDLRRAFGAAYDDYTRRVRWRILPGIY